MGNINICGVQRCSTGNMEWFPGGKLLLRKGDAVLLATAPFESGGYPMIPPDTGDSIAKLLDVDGFRHVRKLVDDEKWLQWQANAGMVNAEMEKATVRKLGEMIAKGEIETISGVIK